MFALNMHDPLTNYKITHFKKILEVLKFQRIEKFSNEKTVSYLNALSISTLSGRRFTVAALKAIKKCLANPSLYRESVVVRFALFLLSTKELSADDMLLLQEPRYRKQNNPQEKI